MKDKNLATINNFYNKAIKRMEDTFKESKSGFNISTNLQNIQILAIGSQVIKYRKKGIQDYTRKAIDEIIEPTKEEAKAFFVAGVIDAFSEQVKRNQIWPRHKLSSYGPEYESFAAKITNVYENMHEGNDKPVMLISVIKKYAKDAGTILGQQFYDKFKDKSNKERQSSVKRNYYQYLKPLTLNVLALIDLLVILIKPLQDFVKSNFPSFYEQIFINKPRYFIKEQDLPIEVIRDSFQRSHFADLSFMMALNERHENNAYTLEDKALLNQYLNMSKKDVFQKKMREYIDKYPKPIEEEDKNRLDLMEHTLLTCDEDKCRSAKLFADIAVNYSERVKYNDKVKGNFQSKELNRGNSHFSLGK